MTTTEEVGRILTTAPTKHDRILFFAALLSRESGSDVVVVGGSAIEVYTRGKYVSGDIDIRAERGPVHRTLKRWGFQDRGRLWTRSDWGVAVDVVGDRYSGDLYRATTVSTPYGHVRIAVVEDLFVKRLAAAKHWRVRDALKEATLLWNGYRDAMDDRYLASKAQEYHVDDLLAEFQKQPRRSKSVSKA